MALVIKHEQLSIASLGWSLAPGVRQGSQVPGKLWLRGGGGEGVRLWHISKPPRSQQEFRMTYGRVLVTIRV